MADIFSTGPTRSGYASGASGAFLAPRIAESTASDQLARTLGQSLGNIGVGAFREKKKPSALDQFRLQREQAQADAEAQIADLAGATNLDDIQANYRQALVVGARAGMDTDKVDKIFTGTARAIGGEDNTIGRLNSGTGGYGPDTYFSPDGASRGRNVRREQTLADQAGAIVEQQRREGVQQRGREFVAGANRNLETMRQTGRETVERLRDSLTRDREKDKTGKPAVTLQGVDDLRRNVTASLADRLGQLPTKEGDLNPEATTVEPQVMGDIMTRANELMNAPNNLSAMDAINKAIEEKADIDKGGPTGGVDLGFLGTHFQTDKKPAIKRKTADPLGIR